MQQPILFRQAEAQDVAACWQIVDEAHHLAWSVDIPSEAYLLVEKLAKQIPSVLLLTATPEQLGQESHFARLALLDPDRFYDYEAFVAEQQAYKPVADAVATLLNNKPLTATEQNSIAELLSEEDTEPMFKVINGKNTTVTGAGTTASPYKVNVEGALTGISSISWFSFL